MIIITLPLENGGLGMFKLDDFLRSQQSMWILRAFKSQRDNWRPDTDESFFHLFFQCPTVTGWHDEFIENFIVPQQPLAILDRKKLFFLGIYSGNYNSFLAAAVFHFQFSIWEEKLSKRVPSFISLKTRFLERFIESVNNTKKLQKAGLKINNPLCRYIP